jgi:hypothetical protein
MNENEIAKYQLDMAKKKPLQVRACMKLYFKYIFTNPLISRLRIKKPLPMTALIHERDDLKEQVAIQKEEVYMYLLLKKKERV